MRARTATLCLLLGLGMAVPAPGILTDGAPRARLIEYGLFQVEGEGIVVDEPRGSSGKKRLIDGHFYAQTDRVPLKWGTCFDIRFEITGLTGADTIEVEKRVEHPAFKNYKGERETRYTVSLQLEVVKGTAEDTTGIILNREEELVPGVWKFEIWYHNRKLLTQSFTVEAEP